jgi:hypothetical protein
MIMLDSNVKLLSNVTKLLPNCFFNVNIFYIFVRETIKTLQDEKYIVIGALLITGMIFCSKH